MLSKLEDHLDLCFLEHQEGLIRLLLPNIEKFGRSQQHFLQFMLTQNLGDKERVHSHNLSLGTGKA